MQDSQNEIFSKESKKDKDEPSKENVKSEVKGNSKYFGKEDIISGIQIEKNDNGSSKSLIVKVNINLDKNKNNSLIISTNKNQKGKKISNEEKQNLISDPLMEEMNKLNSNNSEMFDEFKSDNNSKSRIRKSNVDESQKK